MVIALNLSLKSVKDVVVTKNVNEMNLGMIWGKLESKKSFQTK